MGLGDRHEFAWTEYAVLVGGDGDVAIGRRAGGDTDEEAEEGLEQFVVIILFDVTSIVESF